MSEKLSQEEVDALLNGMADGKVEGPESAADSEGVTPIDLVKQQTGSAGRMPALDIFQENLLRNFTKFFAKVFERLPVVKTPGPEMTKLSTFLKRLAPPLNVHVFEMHPLKGQSLLCILPEMAFKLVDFGFGGTGTGDAVVEEHEYSATENRLLKRLAASMIGEVERSWNTLYSLHCRYIQLEDSPAAVAAMSNDDMVAVFQVELTLTDSPMILQLCFPYSAVKVVNQNMSAGESPDASKAGGDWRAVLHKSLLETEVVVEAELGTAVMLTRKVLGLKVGDTITLESRRSHPISVKVEGMDKFHALPGLVENFHAVKISSRVRT